MESAIRLDHITKRFGSTVACADVTLEINRGEIHAVVGENGAGKSTLMNVLYGLVHPDEGEIWIHGSRADIRQPLDAIEIGIGMVHQHMMQVSSYSVVDNIILGCEPRTRLGLTDRSQALAEIEHLTEKFGISVSLDQPVCDLPIGLRQRVEIVKLLYRGADIMILDEPTAILSPQGIEELLDVMRNLREEGKTIIFISHKLPEVLAVSDRVSVMRKGRLVGTVEAAETTQEDLVELMMGTSPPRLAKERESAIGEAVLEVKKMSACELGGNIGIFDASFRVRKGEILAIAGVEGNGQRELASAIVGLMKPSSGTVVLMGEDITHLPVGQRRKLGMAFVPEDRVNLGLVIDASITDNAILGRTYQEEPVSAGGLIDWKAADAFAEEIISEFRVKSPDRPGVATVEALSGGNMQKVLVGRELSHELRCLVICQPTQGLDVGAKQIIYEALFAKRDEGCGILLISSDLEEIFDIADRVLVIYKGRLVADLDCDETTIEEVGLYMTGANYV
ncbi:MAG TPA: ABC transporter ATP-binding protein [Firmicutes bacterium]|nr:ABC transporter ATP-binding protein [Bacillota bacterium]